MDDIPLVHDFQSQILIIQLPPVNERIIQIDKRKPKIFFHLLEKWMIFLSFAIFNPLVGSYSTCASQITEKDIFR